eukprot:7041674-Alexandrium_andersonii.AAC.1
MLPVLAFVFAPVLALAFVQPALVIAIAPGIHDCGVALVIARSVALVVALMVVIAGAHVVALVVALVGAHVA